MDYFLALSEVMGHLDVLVEAGRVEIVREGEVVRWKATRLR
jgi:DNA-binding transcriptional ArsR family regulator